MPPDPNGNGPRVAEPGGRTTRSDSTAATVDAAAKGSSVPIIIGGDSRLQSHDPGSGSVSAPSILSVALWLAEHHGCHVFRVDHPGRPECAGAHRECDGQRGKHPAGPWSRMASRHPAVIRAMFADGPWNIGIACKLSGLLVVDEDKPPAFAEFAAAAGKVIKPTFAVQTAKGTHWYYRQPEGSPLGNGRGALAGRGIDIRGGGAGNGGYVVGPGSVHATGVVYTITDPSAPVLPVPEWLAEALRPAAGPVQAPQHATGPLRPGTRAERTLCGLVDKVLHARAPVPGVPGERNEILFWAACCGFRHVMRGLLTETDVRSALLEAAIRRGLSHTAALATINSARRNVFGGTA